MSEPMPLEALAPAVRAAFGAGARIVAAEPLAGDASTRRYVRLRLAGAAEAPTAVAMLLGADRLPLGSEEIGGVAGGDELPFVNVGRYLGGCGLPVPAVYHQTPTFLLLEDVGDTTLWAAARADAARVSELFGAAVDLLVALQAAGAQRPAPACYAFRQRFDGRLRILDFQDALLAPDAYDLASLVTDRTTAELVPPALEASLTERFVHGRAAARVPVDPGFAERYRRCALQRALKVIGRFYFLERVKGKPGYLAYLPAVYGVARRMLRAEPALATAATQLVAWVPELGREPA